MTRQDPPISQSHPGISDFIRILVERYKLPDGKIIWVKVHHRDIFHFEKLYTSYPEELDWELQKHETSITDCGYLHKKTARSIRDESTKKVKGICARCGASYENSRYERFPQICPECHRQTIWESETSIYENGNGKPIPNKIARILLHEQILKTQSDSEDIYLYQDGYYHHNAEIWIKKRVQEILGDETTSYLKNEVLGCIRGATYTDPNTQSNTGLVNLRNGLLDLHTMTLLPHTPEVFTITQIPITHTPGATCPQTKKFLEEILPPQDIPIIQELIGYCLLPDYRFQRAFMLLGDGRNGKSTLLNLTRIFLGKENTTSIDLHEIIQNRFTRAQLLGKLANIYPDLTSKTLNHTGIFKALTGGDSITADRKFKNPITFINTAKLIFSANELPQTLDDTLAFYRRWIILNFPHKFEGDNCDPQKLEKLTTPQELSGLLNWALEGLQRLLTNGDFSHSMTAEETQRYYTRLASSVAYYLEENIEENPDGWVSKDELYSHYTSWCRNNNLPITPKNIFSKEIHQYVTVREERRTVDKRQVRGWRGISLHYPTTHHEQDSDNSQGSQDSQVPLYFYSTKKENTISNNKIGNNLTNPPNPSKPQTTTKEESSQGGTND